MREQFPGAQTRWIARAELILSWGGAGVALIMLFLWLPQQVARSDVREVDLYVYYQTAVRLAHGQPIYTGPFVYPPMFAALIRPAAAMPLKVFQACWYVMVMGAFWAYATGLARLAFQRLTLPRVLAVAALLAVTPGTNAVMSLGNIDLIIWALVAWSLPDGAGLALAACLKVYPAVVAVAAAIRRPSIAWRQLGAATVVVSLSLVLLGPGPFIEWLRMSAVPLPDCTLLPANISLSTGVIRLLHVTDLRGGFARAIYVIVPALLVGGTFWRTRRWSATAAGAAVLVATAWSAPVCWSDWVPILHIPLAVWLRNHLRLDTSVAVDRRPPTQGARASA